MGVVALSLKDHEELFVAEDYIGHLLEVNKRLEQENDQLRTTQTKLIELLRKADEHSDKLEWKLFWESKDKIIYDLINKKK